MEIKDGSIKGKGLEDLAELASEMKKGNIKVFEKEQVGEPVNPLENISPEVPSHPRSISSVSEKQISRKKLTKEEIKNNFAAVFNHKVMTKDLIVEDYIFKVKSLDSSTYLSPGLETLTDKDLERKNPAELMRKFFKYFVRALVSFKYDDNELPVEELIDMERGDPNFYIKLEEKLLSSFPIELTIKVVDAYVSFFNSDMSENSPGNLEKKR